MGSRIGARGYHGHAFSSKVFRLFHGTTRIDGGQAEHWLDRGRLAFDSRRSSGSVELDVTAQVDGTEPRISTCFEMVKPKHLR